MLKAIFSVVTNRIALHEDKKCVVLVSVFSCNQDGSRTIEQTTAFLAYSKKCIVRISDKVYFKCIFMCI